MSRKLLASAILVFFPWGILPAAAQDTEGLGTIVAPLEPKRGVGLPDQAPPRTEVAPPSPRAAATPKNSPTPKAPEAPDIIETRFSDWAMECLSAERDTVPCQIVHRALSPDGQQVVMVLSMAYAAKANETKLQLALPLGFAVQDGVSINLGDDFSDVVRVSRCTAQGCLVDGIVAPEMVAAMSKGKTGSVSIKTVEGSTISLPLSLSGFDEALGEMKKKNTAAPS